MSETSSGEELKLLLSVGPQILSTKRVALGFVAMHMYDHLLTLADEIRFMWTKRVTLVSILFFFNRYYSLLFSIICLYVKAAPLMDRSVCEKFALFLPIGGGIVLTIMPNAVVAIRVYALYGFNKLVLMFLVVYLSAELGVALWIYLTPGHHEQGSGHLGCWTASLFQMMQVGYDTIIILFTINKTLPLQKRYNLVCNRILQDGIIYYVIMVAANLTWAIMILASPDELKYVAASPTLMLASTMISRLTISLRKQAVSASSSSTVDASIVDRQHRGILLPLKCQPSQDLSYVSQDGSLV